jgi:hypothetical protein
LLIATLTSCKQTSPPSVPKKAVVISDPCENTYNIANTDPYNQMTYKALAKSDFKLKAAILNDYQYAFPDEGKIVCSKVYGYSCTK